MLQAYEDRTRSDDDEKIVGDYLCNLFSVKQLTRVHVDITEYQHVGDTNAPFDRVIDPNQRQKKIATAK